MVSLRPLAIALVACSDRPSCPPVSTWSAATVGFDATFDGRSLRAERRGVHLDLSFAGWARGSAEPIPTEVAREWYRRRPGALEHGFELAGRLRGDGRAAPLPRRGRAATRRRRPAARGPRRRSAVDDCAPYACDGMRCKSACLSSADCAGGFVCDAQNRCVTPPQVLVVAGGCSLSSNPSPRRGGWWMMGLFLAVFRRRRCSA